MGYTSQSRTRVFPPSILRNRVMAKTTVGNASPIAHAPRPAQPPAAARSPRIDSGASAAPSGAWPPEPAPPRAWRAPRAPAAAPCHAPPPCAAYGWERTEPPPAASTAPRTPVAVLVTHGASLSTWGKKRRACERQSRSKELEGRVRERKVTFPVRWRALKKATWVPSVVTRGPSYPSIERENRAPRARAGATEAPLVCHFMCGGHMADNS